MANTIYSSTHPSKHFYFKPFGHLQTRRDQLPHHFPIPRHFPITQTQKRTLKIKQKPNHHEISVKQETIKPSGCFFFLDKNSSTLLSVPVMRRLVRTFNRHTNVISLIFSELSELSSELAEVKCSNFLVEVLWQYVNLLLIFSSCLLLP